jgi:hypothetical protein
MPTTVVGNPTAARSPSLAPGPGIVPAISVPNGNELRTIESITQALEVPTDASAYLLNGHFSSFMQESFLMNPATYTTAQAPIPNSGNWRLLVNGTHWNATVATGLSIQGGATVSGDYIYWATSGAINGSGLGLSSQYSVEFDLNQQGASSVNGVARIGLGDNAQLDAAANYAYLMTAGPASTWTLNVNGTTSVLGAGFNPGGGIQRIRINGFGSATAAGVAHGSAYTEVWINNAFATSVNACATTALYPALGMKASGNITGMTQQCNCITMRWNRF